jgi:hypothetical protein
MSMPHFPKIELTKEQAINSILTSIALEEAALSHILNAEGEKIQYVLANSADMHKIIETNESVNSLIDRIVDLQIILKNKMRLAKEFSLLEFDDGPPCPPPSNPCRPCPPVHKPCPPPKC